MQCDISQTAEMHLLCTPLPPPIVSTKKVTVTLHTLGFGKAGRFQVATSNDRAFAASLVSVLTRQNLPETGNNYNSLPHQENARQETVKSLIAAIFNV